MTREEADFIGGMNMCDEISNEAYKKIMCHCEDQEPCEDAISRAEVLKKAIYTETEDGWSGYTVSVEDIKDLSSVQPKPKTGSWRKDIDNSRRWDRVRFYCSECGSWQTYGETDFCPSCGAKMEREKT